MSDRRPFLLRVDRALLEALQVWANDELRSLNGQIEYLLRQSLVEAGRLKRRDGAQEQVGESGGGTGQAGGRGP
jgi:hypothetical protein